MATRLYRCSTAAFLAAGLLISAQETAAQSSGPDTANDTIRYELDPITVTATRTARPVSQIPVPVSVVLPSALRERIPNTVTDLFRDLPGLDVTGTGANQARPVIRGQRGQRILLLQDGIRLNNSRRQQDFGELPALVDVSGVRRVEVVRGPGSVLYGTDAIGGVINIITERTLDQGVHGSIDYRYGDAQSQNKGTVSLFGAQGAFDFNVLAAMRDANAYAAPAGTFGDLTLADQTEVQLTGVEDRNIMARFGYQLSEDSRIRFGFDRYEADDAGFGFVDPAAYNPGDAEIRITYPFQDFTKFTAGFQADDLGFAIADRFDFTAYYSDNERRLDFELFQGFGPQAPPGAGVLVETEGFSDLETVGFRAELKKLVASDVLLTYGADFFRDDSKGTDLTRSTISGFGPPMVDESTAPNVPNAHYTSLGGFLQAEWDVSLSTRIVAGARAQNVSGESLPTDEFVGELGEFDRTTAVGSVNLLQELGSGVTAIAAVGRAFRAPNLVEMFFEGPTPEGSGYQARNNDLKPETSLNFDLGLRYRTSRISAEAFVFRNEIEDGIRIASTGDTIMGFPVSTNVNVAELRYIGVELALGANATDDVTFGGSFTWMDSEDSLDPDNPIGDSYSNKATGWVRYDHPRNLFWAQFDGRRNGEQKEAVLVESPIGQVMPAFTVLNLRGGLEIPHEAAGLTYRLGVSLENLTDELYAEFANVSFFRPQPGRNLTFSLGLVF